MKITISESKINFGAFTCEDFFYIEKSKVLKDLNKKAKQGEGIKMSEFLLLERKGGQTKIYIVEAKFSAPHYNSELNFPKYINTIKEKFENSLSFFMSLYLQRHPDSHEDLSNNFKQLDFSCIGIMLILVIKNVYKDSIIHLQASLRKELKKTIKTWNLSPTSIVILDEKGARKYGLVNDDKYDLVKTTHPLYLPLTV